MKNTLPLAFVIVLGLATIGCGPASKTERVSGVVDLDGVPVKEGRILFRAVNAEGRAFSGTITDGAYSLDCEPGRMRVEITASRLIPGKFDSSNGVKEPVGEMYIPKKYNARSELNVEVDASNLEHAFHLKSK